MATEREESEAEMAAKALYGFGVRLGQPYGGDHVPQHVAQLQAVYTVGSEIVRALGRIESELRQSRESQSLCEHGLAGVCMYCLTRAVQP